MIKLLLLTMLCGPVFAKTEKEISIGSLSYHLLGNQDSFRQLENKVSSDGRLIANGMLTYKVTERDGRYYASDAGFIGQNSVGTLMAGYLGSVGIYASKSLQLGFVGGVYIQDNRKFIEKEIVNLVSAFSDSPVNIVPVFGAEVNFKANITKKYFIKLNNVITPAVTNHTVSFGVEF